MSKSGIPDTDKWRLLSVSEGPQDREVLGRFLSIYDIEFNPDSAELQSGASSRAKIGGAYFSDVTGSIQDPIAVPGPCEVT